MRKVIVLSFNDIAIDPEEAASVISQALRRSPKLHYAGFGLLANDLMIFLDDIRTSSADGESSFVFSNLGIDCSPDTIAATAQHRYAADYSTLAVFPIEGIYWGLFCKNPGA